MPGETFRQFNERIGASSKSPNKDKDLKKKKDFRSRIAEEFVEARGLNKKRKEYLKKRDQKKKEKQRLFAGGVSDEEDLDEVRMDSVGFREQVQAPPVLKVLPKASFKFKGKI